VRTRDGVQDVQLLDENGVNLEPAPEQGTGIEEYFR
jgi:hypothetical protein